ncbi:MAG: hypothetical protein CME88_03655 [Hirschia sp.]|nr:hypothetical protein [Hirschia sp.]MBF17452.1 hypothetical protein [Hirschia sp.]|tara:strand:+ start:182 stop:583 length:402 start_codon:yes stop_codon:yes gene_type:complete
MRFTLFAACLLGGTSVVMGAIGGHAAGASHTAWMTGVFMGMLHALAAMLSVQLSPQTKLAAISARSFVVGGALFGASIWIKILLWGAHRTELANAERSPAELAVAMMAPLGGMTLIASWILLAIACLQIKPRA